MTADSQVAILNDSDGYAKQYASLSPEHEKLIIDSGIDPEVSRERGYRTDTVKAHLRR